MPRVTVHEFDAIASTNDEAMRLLREGAPDGTVVWAKRQTAGRGRMGKSWDSPEGNLYMSVVARVDLPAQWLGRVAVTCGRGCANLLSEITGLFVCTKWPNDLYIYREKAGGILVESRLAPGGGVEGIVVGLGLNVLSHPELEPPAPPATCLADHGFVPDSLESIMRRMAVELLGCAHVCGNEDWLELISISNHIDILGLRDPHGEDADPAEDALGLAEDGALIVRRGGREWRVVAPGT